MLLRPGFARPQVPVRLACFQCRQVGAAPVSGAVAAAGRPRAFPRGGGSFPQQARTWRSLLGRDSLPLALHQEPATQVLLDLNLDPGVCRTTHVRQQLQGAPVVLDGVVPGHFAAVFEAQDPMEGHRLLQGTVGRTIMLGRHAKLLIESLEGIVAGSY